MPESIDTSLDNLWWLRPQGWADTGRNDFLEGQRVRQEALRIGQQESQFRRDQVMQLLQYNLREKEANVRMAAELQQQKMMHDYMEDFPKVNAWADDPEQPIPKDLQSPKSMELIDQIRLRHSQSIVARDSTKAFAERVKKLNEISPELAGPFAPAIGRIPNDEILSRLAVAEGQAADLQRQRLTQPVAPGERVTAKIGGVTTTITGAKLETPEAMALKTRSLDLREQQLAIEDQRLVNATEQMKLRGKALDNQQRRQMQIALKANPTLLEEVNKLQTNVVEAEKELSDLKTAKAAGSTKTGFWRRDIDTVIAEKESAAKAAKAEHDSMVNAVLESMGMQPAATATTPSPATNKFRVNPQTGLLEPVQ